MSVAQRIKLLEKSKESLDNITDELKSRGYRLAASEREYMKALAIKEDYLRSGKGGRCAANLASDIAKGDPTIAELRYKRDIAQVEYDLLKDKLRNERMNSEILRSLLAYDRANYLNS